jgi:hypothetical protein
MHRSTQSEPKPWTEISNQLWCMDSFRLGESMHWIDMNDSISSSCLINKTIDLIMVHKLNYDLRIHGVLHFGDLAWIHSLYHSLISALTGLSVTLHCYDLYVTTL